MLLFVMWYLSLFLIAIVNDINKSHKLLKHLLSALLRKGKSDVFTVYMVNDWKDTVKAVLVRTKSATGEASFS